MMYSTGAVRVKVRTRERSAGYLLFQFTVKE